MAYGDLSVFLPRAEGDKLNVEQARQQAEQKAAYLSSMDQFYEQLKESQRQFDISQALAERQFEWQSGFEEKRLAQEGELTREELALQEELASKKLAWEREYGTETLALERERLAEETRRSNEQFGLQKSEQEFLQNYYGEQLSLEKERFGLEEEIADLEIAKANQGTSSPYQRKSVGLSLRPLDLSWAKGSLGSNLTSYR